MLHVEAVTRHGDTGDYADLDIGLVTDKRPVGAVTTETARPGIRFTCLA
jgi:hypothetical protein